MDGKRIVLGDRKGQVILISLECVENFPAVVTPKKKSGKLFFRCPYCQEKNQIKKSSLEQEVICTSCGKTVKLNPFTVKLD